MPLDEAVDVMDDILAALEDLANDVVHRDLKPENVLSFDGHWQIADFGISRYAEATTASDTRKHYMTPPYAHLSNGDMSMQPLRLTSTPSGS
jgi:serine/threonine-protein kinase